MTRGIGSNLLQQLLICSSRVERVKETTFRHVLFWKTVIVSLRMNRNSIVAAGAVRGYKCIWLVLFASLVLHTHPAYSFSVHSTIQVLSKVIIDTSARGLLLWRSYPAGKATFNSRSTLRRDVMTAVWRDSVVSLTIPASKERTYDLFSSLDQHPTW